MRAYVLKNRNKYWYERGYGELNEAILFTTKKAAERLRSTNDVVVPVDIKLVRKKKVKK